MKALIVIDLQNDYFKGGKIELVNSELALKEANIAIKIAREKGYKIYFIQHIAAKKDASFFLPNSYGVKLHENLDIQNDTIIQKHYPNSFRETTLKDELDKHNINKLIICGAMTHMCIDTTVRAAFDLGYKIELLANACATKDLSFNGNTVLAKDVQNSFLSALNGTFCNVVNSLQ